MHEQHLSLSYSSFSNAAAVYTYTNPDMPPLRFLDYLRGPRNNQFRPYPSVTNAVRDLDINPARISRTGLPRRRPARDDVRPGARGNQSIWLSAQRALGLADREAVAMDIDPPFDASALGLKEIGNLASWTVSTCKPGCGVEALRDEDTALFWQ